MKRKYTAEAEAFIEAIKEIAQKGENLDNLELYLSAHFGEWLQKFANTPSGLVEEMHTFASMEI